MFNSSWLTWAVQVGPGPPVLISRNHGKTLMARGVPVLWLKTLVLCKQSVCAEHSQPPFLGAFHPARVPACWQTVLKFSTSHPSKAYGNGEVMGKDCKILLGAAPWACGMVSAEGHVEQEAGSACEMRGGCRWRWEETAIGGAVPARVSACCSSTVHAG